MVDFKSFAEDCKWRGSRVCKAIGNFCEIDNCALYAIIATIQQIEEHYRKIKIPIRRRRKRRKVAKKKTET